jgi:hypothetical protein
MAAAILKSGAKPQVSVELGFENRNRKRDLETAL